MTTGPDLMRGGAAALLFALIGWVWNFKVIAWVSGRAGRFYRIAIWVILGSIGTAGALCIVAGVVLWLTGTTVGS